MMTMTKTRTTTVLLLMIAASVAAAGCVGGADEAPEAPAEVELVATDYAFSAPAEVPAGVALLRLVNRGSEPHHATLFRIEDGKTFEDVAAAFRTPGPAPAWLRAVGGPNAAMPGASTEALADLEPGLHVWVCFIPDASGTPHFAHGMMAPMVAVAPGGAAAPPAADATWTLHDYGFRGVTDLASGERTVLVRNEGPQAHEVVLVRLEGNATARDFMMAMAPGSTAPPPGRFVGGLAELAPGESGWFRVGFEPGRYALVCFVPDSGNGAPHFQHGMTAELTVG